MHPLVESATAVAEEVLFPAALAVDTADRVPAGHLDALAAAGLYGIETAGLDDVDRWLLAEVLASGCLATAFVWIQHHGAVRALLDHPEAPAASWVGSLLTGERRAGIAIGGVRPPDPTLRARPADGVWLLDGSVPWVTGWGSIDLMFTGAVTDDGRQVWGLLDAGAAPTLSARPLRLSAANASRTVSLSFDGHPMGDERLVVVRPDAMPPGDEGGGRMNGSLALGVARRACILMGPSPLDEELEATRARLNVAGDVEMAEARAAACELAFRATARLVVDTGSRSVLAGSHAERLAREAVFTAVFGTRPAIRRALLASFDGL